MLDPRQVQNNWQNNRINQESDQFQNSNPTYIVEKPSSNIDEQNQQNQAQKYQTNQKLKYYKECQNKNQGSQNGRIMESSYNFEQNYDLNQPQNQFQYQQQKRNQIKYDDRFEYNDNRKRNETRQNYGQNQNKDYRQDNYISDYRENNKIYQNKNHYQKYNNQTYYNSPQNYYSRNNNDNFIDDEASFLPTPAQIERDQIKINSIPFQKKQTLKDHQENYAKTQLERVQQQKLQKQQNNFTNLLNEYTLDDIEDKTQEQTNFTQRAMLELHEKQDFIYVTDLERGQQRYEFKTKFHRLKSYSNQQVIRDQFPCLKKVNLSEMPQRSSVFVLIRCGQGYNNIHKAIKYGIWTSRKDNNLTLSDLYKQYQNVYLIFLGDSKIESEVNLFGIARLKSDFESEKCFLYWERDCQHLGIFHIEWLYVKTLVPSMVLASGYNSYRKQDKIQQLRDGTILDETTGNLIFQQFNAAHDYPSLFDQFNALDILEDQLRYARQNDSNFQKQMERTSQQITNRYLT